MMDIIVFVLTALGGFVAFCAGVTLLLLLAGWIGEQFWPVDLDEDDGP